MTTTSVPVYGMSGAGACIKALVAERLDYEPLKPTPDDEERLNYYSRCEALAAYQIEDLGYELEFSGTCLICDKLPGRKRMGIHVETTSTLFGMIGHLDRRIILQDGRKYPVEIKSLGRNSWFRFKKEGFAAFPNYAAQEACYLHAENLPGVYWVLNRDTGQSLRYIVNDVKDELNLPKFTKVTLPVTFSEVEDKIAQAEIYISEKALPEVPYEDHKCMFCRFKYLCHEEPKTAKIALTEELLKAATSWKEGKEYERMASEMIDLAKEVFVSNAKAKDIIGKKLLVSGLSVTYRGMRANNVLDAKKLKDVLGEEKLKDMYTKGKAWEDVSIRAVKSDD